MHPAAKLALAILSLAATTTGLAAGGIDRTTVRFAQVAVLEGPSAQLGTGLRQGILAAFEEANRAGGIHGRTIQLDSFDDGYEPEESIRAVAGVIEGDEHIALIGQVGTAQLQATQTMASHAGLPVIGPMTGADFARAPWVTNVINIRSTYGAEVEAAIAHLADVRGLERVAILYQDDAFGETGRDAVRASLRKRGLSLVAEETYTRNTAAVKVAVLKLRKAEPEAVFFIGTHMAVATFIDVAQYHDFTPDYASISLVGSKALAEELGADGAGVIISQVVPFPWDDSLPVVAEFIAALSELDAEAEPGFASLEGYLSGRVAIRALQNAGPWLTREGFAKALSGLGEFDLGGLRLAYGPGDNQGLDQVYLSRIGPDGRFEPVERPVPEADS
ncbi:Leucine-, isoleucine-, valine-, threonine-, and alanine-binding protein [Rhodovulum sp. P5]|uniref:ABC transporter substrate-binding protein n=1 Tax=Rhodovulum sp. P5 TaxID=1564506 RepID=UPI0009C33D6F|nr:ABC transporter substrate-binding protein [Rhodovulum sp. P5]ARE41375.1 Leucine-, isoleucine-, valine-, threonine-, and alanine-binding protein [Rhodovulum sp. P5]